MVHDKYGTLVVNDSGHVVNRCETPAEAHAYMQEVYRRRQMFAVAAKTARDPARRAVNAAVLELIDRHRDEYETLRREFLDLAC